MDKNMINHVYPVNDDYDHLLETEYDMANQLKCRCNCNPRLEFHRDEYYITGVTVIHNSFDGREAVEWANEILNKEIQNDK